MDALNIYLSTWSLVFCSEADSAEDWASIGKHFSRLRKALTCCVCEKLLTSPVSSSVSKCEHCVCRACVNKKMQFKQPCDCCKDVTNFTENYQMRLLLNCFQCLCEHVINSSFLYKWGHLNGGKSNTLADIVQEGVRIERDVSLNSFRMNSSVLSSDYKATLKIDSANENKNCNGTVSNGNCSSYSSDLNNSTNNIKEMNSYDDCESSEKQDSLNEFVFKKPSMTVSMMRSFRLKKKGCRCGLATSNPGKLTCCGQRCPCYVEGKACTQCNCKGCRNPHKFVKNGRSSNWSNESRDGRNNSIDRKQFIT